MLSLQLKSGEYITIGDDIVVQIFEDKNRGVFRVAVKAPREVPILRGAVLERTAGERPREVRPDQPRRKSPSDKVRSAKRLDRWTRLKESGEAEN